MSPLLVSVLFLLTFGPKVYGFDLISATSVAVLVCHAWVGKAVHRAILPYVALLLAAAAYAMVVAAVNGAADLYHVLRTGRAVLNFAAAYALVVLYMERYEARFPDRLLADLFIVIALHGTLMAAMYASTGMRDVVYRLTGFHESYARSGEGIRISGLTEGLGTLSVTQAAGLWMALFVRHLFVGRVQQTLFVLAVVFVALSVALSGRTGQVLAVVFVPMAWTLSLGRAWRRRVRASFGDGRISPLSVLVALAVVVVLIGVTSDDVRSRFVNETFPHAAEPFTTLAEEGRLATRSTDDVLEDQFFLPSSVWVTIFGNSNSGRGALPYVPSDTGVVRILFGLGLIGSIIIYAFYALATVHALKIYRRHEGLTVVAVLFCAGIMVANFKTVLALTRNGFTVTACLVAATVLVGQRSWYSPQTRDRDVRKDNPVPTPSTSVSP